MFPLGEVIGLLEGETYHNQTGAFWTRSIINTFMGLDLLKHGEVHAINHGYFRRDSRKIVGTFFPITTIPQFLVT